MSMIPILVKRDFTSRVKATAYIVTTVLGVLVFIGLAFLPPIIEYFSASFSVKNIELLVLEQPAETKLAPYLLQISEEQADLNLTILTEGDERDAYQQVLDQGLTGLLLIDVPLYTLVTNDGSNMAVNNKIEGIIGQAVTRLNAERLGLSEQDMNTLFQQADLRIREISPLGEGGQEIDSVAHTQAMVLAYFLLFMIYMALIMYGNMVASGVAEEKSSRIMEVMVATVSPLELMFGKIIGVGALGLLQLLIWTATGLLLTMLGKAGFSSGVLGVSGSLGTIPLSTVFWFGLYFSLGYFFYASIFAAGGALVSRVEEVSQVVTLIMMFIIVGFFAAYISFVNPNSSFAVATSLIPFTAPMVMFARIVLANPPIIQVVASVLILVFSVVAGAWISSKIYRIGILLYGKRPGLKQVIRLVRE